RALAPVTGARSRSTGTGPATAATTGALAATATAAAPTALATASLAATLTSTTLTSTTLTSTTLTSTTLATAAARVGVPRAFGDVLERVEELLVAEQRNVL